jgi:triosephosphate isomerase
MGNKLIVGNWKMNGTLADNATLLAGLLNGLAADHPARVAVVTSRPGLRRSSPSLTPPAPL